MCGARPPADLGVERNAAWVWLLTHARAQHEDTLMLDSLEAVERDRRLRCPAWEPWGDPEEE